MRIEYIGSHAHVVLPVPDQRAVECDRGGEVNVPDDFGRALVKQQPMNWREAGQQPALEDLTVAQLQDVASEKGIETKGLKKAELIEAIRSWTPPDNGAPGESKDGDQ